VGHPINIPATAVIMFVAIILGTPVAPLLLVGWAAVCEYLPGWTTTPIWVACAATGIYCNILIISKILIWLKS